VPIGGELGEAMIVLMPEMETSTSHCQNSGGVP